MVDLKPEDLQGWTPGEQISAGIAIVFGGFLVIYYGRLRAVYRWAAPKVRWLYANPITKPPMKIVVGDLPVLRAPSFSAITLNDVLQSIGTTVGWYWYLFRGGKKITDDLIASVVDTVVESYAVAYADAPIDLGPPDVFADTQSISVTSSGNRIMLGISNVMGMDP